MSLILPTTRLSKGVLRMMSCVIALFVVHFLCFLVTNTAVPVMAATTMAAMV
jgi:hypothetical protein